MLEEYWPSQAEVEKCIRTEAEELAEHVLLAVHEPMRLEKRKPGEGRGEDATETDLLEQLLKVARPIPIIGESGIGKSHLVRWLNAKLKVHPEAARWHIRRVPKNAGLRGVLERLLGGLEGEKFEEIRKRIASVGDQLTTKQVADYLIVGMGHSLERLAEQAQRDLEELRKAKERPDRETEDRFRLLARHVSPDKLPVLLNDPFFNKILKDPERGCIYQIAKRLTGESDATEVARNEYRIREDDLNFNLTLMDLSRDARNYVRRAMLNTSEDSRAEVTSLLNEIINYACRDTFYHFFHFNSESFQDLFRDIRRHLHIEGKTLVLLVEDMAAISAIEDVLIDSLLEEGITEGQEVLCPLRSAIAVTEGYEGYKRRRNTLATRAQFEWYIPKRSANEKDTLARIENFCGRYLNAARIGERQLRETYQAGEQGSRWPETWCAEESADMEVLDLFGVSEEGVPLFPFSKRSIQAFANEFCKEHDEIVFVPRDVLGHVLIKVLRDYHDSFEMKRFPPGRIGRFACPGQLAADLEVEVSDDRDRVETFAAIWGFGSNTLVELASAVPASMARAFHLGSLADTLDRIRDRGDIPPPPLPGNAKPELPKGEGPPSPLPQPEVSSDISAKVDKWFVDRAIPQAEANVIREALVAELEGYARTALRWWGVVAMPRLEVRRLKMVHVGYSAQNPTGNIVAYFGEKDGKGFEQEPVRFKAVISAILRKKHYGSWSAYSAGYEDYCRYRNFLSEWLPAQVKALVERERKAAETALIQHAELALPFEPRLEKLPVEKRLAVLVQADSVLREDVKSTGLGEWDRFVADALDSWGDAQAQWLRWFTPGIAGAERGRRGIEGDLVFSRRTRFVIEMPRELRRVIDTTRRELSNTYKTVIDFLKGCASKQEYDETLEALMGVVEKLKSEDQYKGMPGGSWTSRQFLNRIQKVETPEHWSTAKALLALFDADENVSQIKNINLDKLNDLNGVLTHWSTVYEHNYLRIRGENLAAGADRREKKKADISELFSAFAAELAVNVGEKADD